MSRGEKRTIADCLGEFLELLSNVRRRDGGMGWEASCPVSTHGKGYGDRNPSLHINEGDEGVVLHCKAGCTNEEVVAAVGRELKDLFPDTGKIVPIHIYQEGCTLEGYAQSKGLDTTFLASAGLTQTTYRGKPRVRMPYYDTEGKEIGVQYRVGMTKPESGPDNRFWRPRGSKLPLYGLEHIPIIRQRGYAVLCEGESDCHILRQNGIMALGIPGAENWSKALEASGGVETLEGIDNLYAIIEPDEAGNKLRKKLMDCIPIADRLHLVDLSEHKDAADLYAADPENFKERFREYVSAATSALEWEEHQTQTAGWNAWATCEDLATQDDILETFVGDIRQSGVVGESRAIKIMYLALTSRIFNTPISAAIKGPSSSGKSFVTEQTLKFFPDDTYMTLTGMSERALIYDTTPLSHRFIVIFEATGMEGEMQSYVLRSLLSEGKIHYSTVVKTADGLETRRIQREGPTGLLVTTTALTLHAENETRLLSIPMTDTQKQTSDILDSIATEDRTMPDLERWHALQTWLGSTGCRDVSVPFGRDLARKIPPIATRLRRDFTAIRNLIRAHALLHQASREKTEDTGKVIANRKDYEAIRALVHEWMSDNVEATIPHKVREVVEVLELLYEESEQAVKIKDLARELRLDPSSTKRRVQEGIAAGYITDLEDRPGSGRPHKLIPGDPLPDDRELLPQADELEYFRETGQGPTDTTHHSTPDSERLPAPRTVKPKEEPELDAQPTLEDSAYSARARAERLKNLRSEEEVEEDEMMDNYDRMVEARMEKLRRASEGSPKENGKE